MRAWLGFWFGLVCAVFLFDFCSIWGYFFFFLGRRHSMSDTPSENGEGDGRRLEGGGLLGELEKMCDARLQAQSEGYRVLQEAHRQEVQRLVDENKALFKHNVELELEVSRLKRKLDRRGSDAVLREKIRLVRLEMARAVGISAFHIFPDTVLDDIVRIQPATATELMAIRGIGPKKSAMYGQCILDVIDAHQREQERINA
jgi:superfamily II DNA helicase RecQ